MFGIDSAEKFEELLESETHSYVQKLNQELQSAIDKILKAGLQPD